MPRKTTEAAATTKSKSVAKKIATPRARKTKKTEEAVVLAWEHIAERAYYIHLEAGGDPVENWLRAERELASAA